jgi:ribosomal protein S27E
MNVSREVEGLRFVAECDSDVAFITREIQCMACGRKIDASPQAGSLSLTCTCCGDLKVFWSEAQMHVFLAENWNSLRAQCARSGVAAAREA